MQDEGAESQDGSDVEMIDSEDSESDDETAGTDDAVIPPTLQVGETSSRTEHMKTTAEVDPPVRWNLRKTPARQAAKAIEAQPVVELDERTGELVPVLVDGRYWSSLSSRGNSPRCRCVQAGCRDQNEGAWIM